MPNTYKLKSITIKTILHVPENTAEVCMLVLFWKFGIVNKTFIYLNVHAGVSQFTSHRSMQNSEDPVTRDQVDVVRSGFTNDALSGA